MHVPSDWQEAADRILSRAQQGCLVLVVGVPDVGKSTFCAYLASRLAAAGLCTGAVDADVGQSSIGPPTVIGGGLLLGPIQALEEVRPAASYFVGGISPSGRLLSCVVGVQRVVSRLQQLGAQAVVVDTSGLVLGSAGRALKEHKVDLLQPDAVALLQRGDELINLARLWQRAGAFPVHLLRPSAEAVRRLPGRRRQYRARRFAAYFRETAPVSVRLDRLALRGAWLGQGQRLSARQMAQLGELLPAPALYGEQLGSHALLVTAQWPGGQAQQAARDLLGVEQVTFRAPHHFNNVLCGLLDGAGDLLALAILHHIDFTQDKLYLIAPQPWPQGGRILHLGRLLLRPDGVELGALRPGDL